MMQALAEYAGTRRHELTDTETSIWLGLVRRVPADRFMRFLSLWSMREKFMPTPGDAGKALGLIVTPEQAFESAYREVRRAGPWSTPTLDDYLAQTVALMGGWERFCQDFPASSEEFAFNQFRKRFVELYQQAQAQVEVQGITPSPVLGLEDASRQRRGLPLLEQSLPAPQAALPLPRG
jgi:hypothetical protein